MTLTRTSNPLYLHTCPYLTGNHGPFPSFVISTQDQETPIKINPLRNYDDLPTFPNIFQTRFGHLEPLSNGLKTWG
jgi:hypothetical protein